MTQLVIRLFNIFGLAVLVACVETATNDECEIKLPTRADIRSGKFLGALLDLDKFLNDSGKNASEVDLLYESTSKRIVSIKRKRKLLLVPDVDHEAVTALRLFNASNTLDQLDCMDRCTYLIAKGNCDIGSRLGACFASVKKPTKVISLMLNTRIFALVRRCQKGLLSKAIELDDSIGDKLVEVTNLIRDRLTLSSPEDNVEDLLERDKATFWSVSNYVSVLRKDFYERLVKLMLELDQSAGARLSSLATSAEKMSRDEVRQIYEQLIIRPCEAYIYQMRNAMDPTDLYGRIGEDNDDLRDSTRLTESERKRYFPILLKYDICTYLNEIDHTAVAISLAGRQNLFKQLQTAKGGKQPM